MPLTALPSGSSKEMGRKFCGLFPALLGLLRKVIHAADQSVGTFTGDILQCEKRLLFRKSASGRAAVFRST